MCVGQMLGSSMKILGRRPMCLLRSCVWLFVTSWTITHQAPLSMEFSRQEYWSRLPSPPPGDVSEPGIKSVSPQSPALVGRFFTTGPPGKPWENQFSSGSQSCLTLCDPMDCSMPSFPVQHQLLELTQIHVRWVGDAIQPSHPLLYPSPPAFNFSQHQGLFKWVSSSHQVAKVLEFQL